MNWPDLHLPKLDLAQVPDWVWPLFFSLFTVWFAWNSYRQYLKGEASLPRTSQIFYRNTQPKMFWFATALTIFHLLLFAAGSTFFTIALIQKRVIDKCAPSNSGSQAYYQSQIRACDASLHSIWADSSTLRLLHDNKGFALQRIGSDQPAIYEFTKAVAIDPEDEWAFYTRGLSYDRLGEARKAIADFDAALKLRPNDTDVLRWRASLNLSIGQASKAIADLNRVAVKDAWVLSMLSLAYAKKDQCDDALRLADKALSLGDKSSRPYQAKGECFGEMRRFEDALIAYDEAIKRNQKDPALYRDRANINFRKEKYEDAIEDLSHGLKVLPDDLSLLYQRCYFRALSNRQPEAGVDDCDNVLKVAPHWLDVLEARVMALYRAGRYAIAERSGTEILRQFPDSSTALYIRGLARKKLGNPLGSSDVALAQDKNASDVSSLSELGFKP
jgi:tetratricopeptide (TPR) repeat protein